MSAQRTIENGEVNIEAPCTCTPQQQIRSSNGIRCRHCNLPIPHSKDRVVEECDLIAQTFVSISVEPYDTHSIITSRTIVSDSERIYEVSGDHNAETISFEVAIRNFETRDFCGVFLTQRNTSSSGEIICRPFISTHGCYVDICPGSGEFTCVLKKPGSAMTMEQFLHDDNTRFTLRFRRTTS